MKSVYVYEALEDAYEAVKCLESAGIKAAITNEHSAQVPGMPGHSAGLYDPAVWIYDVDEFSKARKLLVALEQQKQTTESEPSAMSVWKCHQCEEQNPATFEICWQCKTPAPDHLSGHNKQA